MRIALLKARLQDNLLLFQRITANSLSEYNQTLKKPRKAPSWYGREIYVMTRLVQAEFSKREIESVFDMYPVGENYRIKARKNTYFEQLYVCATRVDAMKDVRFEAVSSGAKLFLRSIPKKSLP